ncbi:MAG TPA: NAD(P)-dependent oxidoreductase [Pyrinomonadaceae bacterium]|nr:NAD(P)-dependent oxidoreductase [Pyrinomonadaceae bacterium]
MNIWITGCSGFLGTRLAKHFAKQHHVTGLSRRDCADASHSVTIDLAKRDAPRVIEKLSAESGAPEVVIHAASKQRGHGDLADFVDANVHSTSNLIEGLTLQPPRLIIYTSTLSVYGRPSIIPVDESNPAGGTLPSGATKRWSEQLLETFQRYSRIVVLRLPSLYGAGQAESFIDGLARTAQLGDTIELFSRGALVRDALHVSDIVRAIDNCIAHSPNDAFSILNLGCGRRTTTSEWAQALVDALDSKSAIVPVDREASQFDLYADISAARRQIAFAPMSLAESMKVYANELRARRLN